LILLNTVRYTLERSLGGLCQAINAEHATVRLVLLAVWLNMMISVLVKLAPRIETYFKDNKMKKTPNPCWDNYKMIGTKKKDGKTVPNCVPKTPTKKK
jgi:hypothetical protein